MSSEYGIAKSTINGWIKDVKEITVDEKEILHQRRAELKNYGHICNKKLDKVIEFIDSNKSNYDIKTMCTVLGVARSTYYKYFDETKSARKIENEELKAAIIRIYKANKGIYGAPRIHYILGTESFNIFLKRVQRRMTELYLCEITVKK